MSRILLIGCIFLWVGCTRTVSKEDLKRLNGYWEIEKVSLPDGTVKEYKVNPTIDYVQIDGLKGFRKKVHPKLDGTYDASNDAELFVITGY